jgi:hypothetical protein
MMYICECVDLVFPVEGRHGRDLMREDHCVTTPGAARIV